MFLQISDMIKLFFLNHSLMSIHTTHHTYNIALTKKQFEIIFFLRNSPVQPLTLAPPHEFDHDIRTLPRQPKSCVYMKTMNQICNSTHQLHSNVCSNRYFAQMTPSPRDMEALMNISLYAWEKLGCPNASVMCVHGRCMEHCSTAKRIECTGAWGYRHFSSCFLA